MYNRGWEDNPDSHGPIEERHRDLLLEEDIKELPEGGRAAGADNSDGSLVME